MQLAKVLKRHLLIANAISKAKHTKTEKSPEVYNEVAYPIKALACAHMTYAEYEEQAPIRESFSDVGGCADGAYGRAS